jgi:PhoH-like ATPase
MIKTYAIDTNVLLYDPRSLLGFEDNRVVHCEKVLRELDEKKKGWGEVPANAREVSRQINQLRQEAKKQHPAASLREGISLPNGGLLRVLSPRARIAQRIERARGGITLTRR